ncbi:WD40-repeat-containing domain protein [Apiosordaria backusii]|uniref:WD40-repeat-containing domain protein n=1 Tax=Apiosordaria backusii TaxID=314023 RepID=A0AA40BED4_9PEZI|nr:WD40-repeat-containing domain protein [Apiosordaria backusii]
MANPKPSTIQGTLANDIVIPPGPEDSISALRWSPKNNHLAAASWDGKVYIYDATNVAAGTASIRGVAAINGNQVPFFDCDFNQIFENRLGGFEEYVWISWFQQEGTMIAAASADHKIHIMDLNSPGQTMTLSGHTAPVRTVRWVDIPCAPDPTGLLVSGSWDKTLRFWDPKRQANPIATVNLSERVWVMDGSGTALIAGTADNKLHYFNLGKMTQSDAIKPIRVVDSPLGEAQIKCLAVQHGGDRWAIGSIGGRVAIRYTAATMANKNFTFRCHRHQPSKNSNVTEVYAVNAVAFARPPLVGSENIVMATAGQDGHVNYWNVRNRQRLKTFPSVGGSITACAFNWDATLFAYAVGYDWGKGYAGNTASHPRSLMLRKVDQSLLA